MIDTYIARFGEELETDFSSNKKSPMAYEIETDEGLVIHIEQKAPGFFFHTTVCECPKKDEETFYTQLLEANLMGVATYNAALGLSDDSKKLTLSYDLDYHVEYSHFVEKLEDFMNAASFWQEESDRFTRV